MLNKKIIILGDYAVGKTSLFKRFTNRNFSDRYLATVGVSIGRKLVEVPVPNSYDSQQIELIIWDIEGLTKLKPFIPGYLQGASGAIIVGDLTRPKTIDHIPQHIKLICSVNPTTAVIIVALNKLDLLDRDSLEKLLAENQFQELSKVIDTYPTSAKTGKNVAEIFHELACHLASQ